MTNQDIAKLVMKYVRVVDDYYRLGAHLDRTSIYHRRLSLVTRKLADVGIDVSKL